MIDQKKASIKQAILCPMGVAIFPADTLGLDPKIVEALNEMYFDYAEILSESCQQNCGESCQACQNWPEGALRIAEEIDNIYKHRLGKEID